MRARSSDIVSISGTTKLNHLRENVSNADVLVDASVLADAERIINHATVAGARYNDVTQHEIDTKMFGSFVP